MTQSTKLNIFQDWINETIFQNLIDTTRHFSTVNRRNYFLDSDRQNLILTNLGILRPPAKLNFCQQISQFSPQLTDKTQHISAADWQNSTIFQQLIDITHLSRPNRQKSTFFSSQSMKLDIFQDRTDEPRHFDPIGKTQLLSTNLAIFLFS